jgi:integrase
MPAFENKPLVKLQPQDVREFMRDKAAAGYAPKSIRHFRATLRTALNVAMGDGLIARNAAALAKPPRLEKPVPQAFTQEEALRFLALIKGHRLEALFSVTLALGLREGEALGLRWKEDIDLDAAELRVSYALQRIKRPGDAKGKLELIEPKTDRSRRTIALPQVAVAALRAHHARQEEERQLAGERWQGTGMVFTTTVGTMLDPRNMLRSFYAIMSTPDPSDPEPDPKKKRKLLPRLRFHDLRHSAATLLLAQGVDARYIMELLGHSSITLTMNTYAHVLKEMQRETARQTDAILNPLAVRLAVKPVAERVN